MGALKLIPAYKAYLWGGDTLVRKYGKTGAPAPLAESWELSLHPDGLTRLEDGRTLSEALTPAMTGENCARFAAFPLLIKLIDAERDLSVQVHPSDAYAIKNEGGYGKTEMWYIVEAKAGAGIYLGFRRDVTEAAAREAIADGSFLSLLHFVPVKAGECYFIPAGTVHAIGAGCLICEIQQNSNLTYRIYDYGRRDASGALRALHTDKAFRVMSRTPYVPLAPFLPVSGERTLGVSRYFHTAELPVSGERTLSADAASFRALVCTAGEGDIDGVPFARGDSFLLPAGETVPLSGDATLVSVSVRRYALMCDADGTLTLADDLGRVHASAPSGGSAAERTAFLSRYGLSPSDIETY